METKTSQSTIERPSDVWKGDGGGLIDLEAHLKRINEATVMVESKRRVLAWLFPEAELKTAASSGTVLRVLDGGCGLGQDLLLTGQYLASHGAQAELVGLDFNATMVAAAGQALPAYQAAVGENVKLSIQEGSLTALNFPDQSFDAIYLNLVMQHLAAEDAEKALSELYRVLKPGGRLVLCQADLDMRTRIYSSDAVLIQGLEKVENAMVALNRSLGLNATYGKMRTLGFIDFKLDSVAHAQCGAEETDPGFVKAKGIMQMVISKGVLPKEEAEDIYERLKTASQSGDYFRTSQMLILMGRRGH